MQIGAALKRLFKHYFVAGTVVLVPLIGTILILRFIVVTVDDMAMSFIPRDWQPETLIGFNIPGLGLVATIVLILLVGFVTRLYIGNKLVALGDWIIERIPLGRSIYRGFKQVLTAIFTRSDEKFQSVVLVEYPRKDCWVMGFVTGQSIPRIDAVDERPLLNVFVPTTPNPTSGFLIFVPENDAYTLNMKIDDAFKLLVSGGMIQDFPAPPTPARHA